MTTDYWLITISLFLLGTAVGSFLNVWSRRLLRGQSPTGRSRCEHCGRILSWRDLIPVLSFVTLLGRCRDCRQPLSWQYPLVELGTGILFAAFALKFLISNYQLTDLLAFSFLLLTSSALVAVFITDFSSQQIFDQMLWVGLASALLYRLLVRLPTADYGLLAYDLIGALGVYLFLQTVRWVTQKQGLGDGDPPLGFWAAILVGFPALLVKLFLAFGIGGAVGAGLVLAKKKDLKDRIAFGPFLVVAVFATILFGEQLWFWYFGVLGL